MGNILPMQYLSRGNSGNFAQVSNFAHCFRTGPIL